MLIFRSTISVSKLKILSKTLGCSFSSLRCTLRSKSSEKSLNNVFRNDLHCSNIYSPSIIRLLSTEAGINESSHEIDMQSITGGNEDLLKKLKVLMLEVEVLRQEGQRVPSVLTNEKWKDLIVLPTRSQRVKQLLFWWLIEKKKENRKKKKEEKQSNLKAGSDTTLEDRRKTDHIFYGFGGSNIFLRIYDTTIDHYMNQNVFRAMMFGQKLIVDCSYDEHMTPKESSLCAKQLMYLFSENRSSDDPFDLYFCNANKTSKLIQKLHKLIPTLYDETFPLNITENSYLDLFPKEQLVYLTPHCRQNLKTYSHDDIYIIGAMVDKVNNDPLSLGKAKALGLRMAKLPLDFYLDWGVGSKSLTLNQVLLILLDMKKYGNWDKAFQNVPKRKLKKNEEENYRPNNFHYLKKRNLIH
ncbi:mitochondrial ribonuclease P protein 1 homolog [Halyomorpha halys]|uniref:mitochondrial ribonuclease P protein 1 homolog n=1 Tax=Halyomorpha halys TaxID=286706 RepID=UPI0006D5051C|nr:mitochondrial ribonuclease P protein 1 homolog [Halyomorpha halys]